MAKSCSTLATPVNCGMPVLSCPSLSPRVGSTCPLSHYAIKPHPLPLLTLLAQIFPNMKILFSEMLPLRKILEFQHQFCNEFFDFLKEWLVWFAVELATLKSLLQRFEASVIQFYGPTHMRTWLLENSYLLLFELCPDWKVTAFE